MTATTNPSSSPLRALRIEFNMTKQQMKYYKKAFDMFDRDSSGGVTAGEIVGAMASVGVQIDEDGAAALIQKHDLNGDGIIDLREFIYMTKEAEHTEPDVEELRHAFEIFDIDNSGYIDMDELKSVVEQLSGTTPTHDELLHIMSSVDKNNDGKISFEEFTLCMRE